MFIYSVILYFGCVMECLETWETDLHGYNDLLCGPSGRNTNEQVSPVFISCVHSISISITTSSTFLHYSKQTTVMVPVAASGLCHVNVNKCGFEGMHGMKRSTLSFFFSKTFQSDHFYIQDLFFSLWLWAELNATYTPAMQHEYLKSVGINEAAWPPSNGA